MCGGFFIRRLLYRILLPQDALLRYFGVGVGVGVGSG
jgi:hypothetical protein